MVAVIVAALLASANPPSAKTPDEGNASQAATARLQIDQAGIPDPDERMSARNLTEVHRIYVDVLTGDESAAQFRDVLISSIQKSNLFVITENQDRADAVLKGAAKDSVFTDKFRSSDNLNLHSQIGGSTRSQQAYRYDESSSHSSGISVGENESTNIEERKHEAFAAVRLVNREGDVIWSSTEESPGGKFLGASADVAEKIAKQLAIDYKRVRAGQVVDGNADRRSNPRPPGRVPETNVAKPKEARQVP